MRKPPKGVLWVHVNRLDHEEGKVWAVQHRPAKKVEYLEVASVVISAPSYSAFFGATGKQPRAVICVPAGSCELRDGIAVITAD